MTSLTSSKIRYIPALQLFFLVHETDYLLIISPLRFPVKLDPLSRQTLACAPLDRRDGRTDKNFL